MAVTRDDVKNVAELARLTVGDDRLDHLVTELNGILVHMDVLSQVETIDGEQAVSEKPGCTPLRSDSGSPLKLEAPRETFAPQMRDGFFIVPRLASHEDGADRTP